MQARTHIPAFEYQICIKDHRKPSYQVSKTIYKSFLVARTELEQYAKDYISSLSGFNKVYPLHYSKSKVYGKVRESPFIATVSMAKVTVYKKEVGFMSTTLTKLRSYTLMKRKAPARIFYNATDYIEVDQAVMSNYSDVKNELCSKVTKVEPTSQEVCGSNQKPEKRNN